MSITLAPRNEELQGADVRLGFADTAAFHSQKTVNVFRHHFWTFGGKKASIRSPP